MDIPKRPRILIGGDDDPPSLKPKPKDKSKVSLDDLFPGTEPDEVEEDDGSVDDGDLDSPAPARDLKTLADLGFTEEPHVTQFKEKHGKYPTMEVNDACRLPTRYSTPEGEQKFHMKTTYMPGQLFHVIGTEPGKRSKTAINIVLTHPTDKDSRIVLTPKDLNTKMKVNTSETLSADHDDLMDESIPMPSKIISEDVKDILEKRKKEAAVSI